MKPFKCKVTAGNEEELEFRIKELEKRGYELMIKGEEPSAQGGSSVKDARGRNSGYAKSKSYGFGSRRKLVAIMRRIDEK